MPNPEDIRLYRPTALFKAFMILRRYSLSDLVCLRKALNHWNWHCFLGDPPKEWAMLPKYRKPGMTESTLTRADYIRPYMCILDTLGVTHRSIYGDFLKD